MVVSFGDGSTLGCRIRGVRRIAGETHLVLDDDPGIVVDGDGIRQLFFPLREVPGQVMYRIRTSAFVAVNEGELRSVGKARFSRSGMRGERTLARL